MNNSNNIDHLKLKFAKNQQEHNNFKLELDKNQHDLAKNQQEYNNLKLEIANDLAKNQQELHKIRQKLQKLCVATELSVSPQNPIIKFGLIDWWGCNDILFDWTNMPYKNDIKPSFPFIVTNVDYLDYHALMTKKFIYCVWRAKRLKLALDLLDKIKQEYEETNQISPYYQSIINQVKCQYNNGIDYAIFYEYQNFLMQTPEVYEITNKIYLWLHWIVNGKWDKLEEATGRDFSPYYDVIENRIYGFYEFEASASYEFQKLLGEPINLSINSSNISPEQLVPEQIHNFFARTKDIIAILPLELIFYLLGESEYLTCHANNYYFKYYPQITTVNDQINSIKEDPDKLPFIDHSLGNNYPEISVAPFFDSYNNTYVISKYYKNLLFDEDLNQNLLSTKTTELLAEVLCRCITQISYELYNRMDMDKYTRYYEYSVASPYYTEFKDYVWEQETN